MNNHDDMRDALAMALHSIKSDCVKMGPTESNDEYFGEARAWAERDNASFRAMHSHNNNPFHMELPECEPQPAMEGQVFFLTNRLNGAVIYRAKQVALRYPKSGLRWKILEETVYWDPTYDH